MRKLLFTLLAFMVTSAMNAEQVSKQQALQKALQFMPGKNFTVVNDRSLARGEDSQTGGESLYIMNAAGGGFVIVSGDDRTEPILGYSDKGEFRTDNIPDNVRNWIEGYVEQIKALDDGGATPVVRARTRSAQPAIEPLITTTWNQETPYNLYCPEHEGRKCVTGCVATALAQMMYYHRWPLNCTVIPGYTTDAINIFRPELPATQFKWEMMKNNYSSSDNDDSAKAVAELMEYVGQACEMDYTPSQSGASVNINAMIDYFGYSKNMHFIQRNSYYTEQWESQIYAELEAGRPVIYDGMSGFSGHMFICDGYDGNGLFHINWGWGGNADGYFALSLANPGWRGVGGGTESYGYIHKQTALLGFQPAIDNEPEIPQIESRFTFFTNAEYTRTSTTENFKNITMDDCYVVAFYQYVPNTTYNVELGWALCQNGNILKVLTSKSVEIDNRDYGINSSNRYYAPETISFGAGVADGRYQIMNVYRTGASTEWQLCETETCYIEAEIIGKTVSLSKASLDCSNSTYTVNNINYTGDMGVGDEIGADITITNTGTTMEESLYFWINQDDGWKKVASGYSLTDPGMTGMVTLSFTLYEAGTFDAKITSDRNGEKVMGTSTITISPVVKVTTGGITYSCNQGSHTATVIEGDADEEGNVNIPSTITYNNVTYTVSAIGSQAFLQKPSIYSLSIPGSVKRIGRGAFWNCYRLTELVLPEGVESIGESAFEGLFDLESVKLPSTIKSIGERAFYSDANLSAVVTLITDVINVTENTFSKNTYSKATLFVPNGTKSKYQKALGWKKFTQIAEGEQGKEKKDGLTYKYRTDTKTAEVIDCDYEQFSETGRVVIPQTVTLGGVDFSVTSIGSYLFYYDFEHVIKDVELPDGIKSIGDWAFTNSIIESIVLPGTLESIGDNAFAATHIYKLKIPEGVKSIGKNALEMTSLEELELPSTLTTIGENTSLNSLKVLVCHMKEPLSINENMFDISVHVDDYQNGGYGKWISQFSSAVLYVPTGSKEKYANAPVWKNFNYIFAGDPKEFTKNGITYYYADADSYAIVMKGDRETLKNKDVVIPPTIEANGKNYSVKKITSFAFYLANIESLAIGEGIEMIDYGAFYYCRQYKRLELPSTLKSIGHQAFYDNDDIEVVISHMKEPCTIGEKNFMYHYSRNNNWCEQIPSATLYVPVNSRGKYANAAIWKDFEVIYEGEPKEMTKDGITYHYITGEGFATVIKGDAETLEDKDVTIPSEIEADGVTYSVKEIEDYAFNSVKMKSLTISTGIERIGMGAFISCYSLEKIDLPSTLTNIGDAAFRYASKLNTVVARMKNPLNISEETFEVSKWVDKDNQRVEVFTSAILYVPVNSRKLYSDDPIWQKFETIYEGEPKELTKDGITYRYVTGDGFAMVTMGDKEILKDKDVMILSTIEAEGRTFPVKMINDKAFYQVQMKSMTIEPGIESIGNEAFWNCRNLKVVEIPEGVKSIGDGVFQYIYYLEKIILPSTLTNIGEKIIYSASGSFKSVVAHMEAPCSVSENAFTVSMWVDNQWVETFASATLFVPSGSKEAYENAPVWQNFSATVVLGDADGNGYVQQEDIDAIANHLLGNTPDGFDVKGADANLDGKINVADIVTVVNMLK